MRKFIIASFTLLVGLLAFVGVASAEESSAIEGNYEIKELTDAEAYQNLVNDYGYSSKEAYEAVFGTKNGLHNNLTATWRLITRYESHAIITGQYKQDSRGWIVDAAPKLTISKRHSSDEIRTIYRNSFKVVDYNRVDMSYKFDWEHFGMGSYDYGTYDRVVPYYFN